MRGVRNGVGLTVEERSFLAEARGTVVIAFCIMLSKFNRIGVGWLVNDYFMKRIEV